VSRWPTHTRWIVVGLACGFLAAAGSAQAATTYYVNKSAATPSDANPCTDQSAPCLTIMGAVNKSKAAGGTGDIVQVLPDPNGFTDTYAEGVVLTGNAITLQGAGAGNGGTLVAGGPTPDLAIDSENASTVRDFHVTGGRLWGMQGNGGVIERVVVESPGASQAALRAPNATVRDSTFVGLRAVEMSNATIVRSSLQGSAAGIVPLNFGSAMARSISGKVLDSVISGPTGTGAVGLSILGSGVTQTQIVQFRHVTMVGFDTRVLIENSGPASNNRLEAANSTLAGPASTKDLALGGQGTTASLININRSPTRTSVPAGSTLEELAPLDVDPLLTADGHLQPGSPLIDRGTTAASAFLAGSAEDTLDIDRQARAQGAAPDVGADEIPVAGGGPGGGGNPTLVPDRVAPRFQTANLTNSTFRVGSRATPLTGVAARRVPTGTTFRFTLSEAGQATITIQRAAKGKRKARRCVKSTPKLRRAKGCTRYVTVGTLRRTVHQGLNSVAFSGRIGRKRLGAAKYRAVLVAVDAANNRSASRTLSFKIVRR
jgi:hypothetical protein